MDIHRDINTKRQTRIHIGTQKRQRQTKKQAKTDKQQAKHTGREKCRPETER